MSGGVRKGYAFNRTREAFLATELSVANTHWTRFRGLVGTQSKDFQFGRGLWIVPCHGVHTLGMRYPIDVVFLSRKKTVVYVATNVEPWRFTPVKLAAATVLELPCHTVWNTGTLVGDQIEISINATKEQPTVEV